MGFYMTLDAPSTLLPDGAVIVQQVSYRKEFNYGDWHTVACKTVVGDASGAEIINFRGSGSIDGLDESGNKVTWDMAGDDQKVYDSVDGSEYYQLRDDEDVYSLEDFGEYTGNKMQNCLAQLPFPKVGVNEEFFGTYNVEFTARIYNTADDTDFTQVDTTITTQEFQPPYYADEDLIYEIEEENSVHSIVFIDESFTFAMSDMDSTFQGDGIQSITGTIFVKPGEESEQRVEIFMNTTIPAIYGESMDGWVIMNYLSFQNVYDSSEDPAKLICTTTVGDEWAHEVHQYTPDNDLSAEWMTYNETAAIPASESAFKPSDELENYKTDSDGTVAWALCTIDIVLNEHTESSIGDIFGKVYDTTYGVKLQPADGSNMIDGAESNFEIELPYPEYDDTWEEEEEEALAENFFAIDTTSFMSDGSSKDAYMAFSVSYNVTDEYTEPDLLFIRLETDAPTEVFT